MNLIPFRDVLIVAITDQPVYMYHFPETELSGILLLHNMNGAKLDPNLPDLKKGKLQAIIRVSRNDFENGYALSKQVIAIFKAVKHIVIDGTLIHFIEPMSDPVPFPVSKGNFIEFSCNFETAYTEH